MKRILLLGSLIGLLYSFNTSGQTASCSETMNRVFKGIPTDKPKVLQVLGTSPQFGEIPQHTAYSAYNHLKKVHTENKKNSRQELDTFLKGLGYAGFRDPAFTASSLIPETLPSGTTGWMGAYAQGHQYVWSTLGKPFEGFKIQAKDGSCFAYIMKKCGNAFFVPGSTLISSKADAQPCETCVEVNFQVKGEGEIHSGQFFQETQTLQVVGNYEGKSLDLGKAKAPVKLAYEYSASAKTVTEHKIPVCDQSGKNQSYTSSMTIPVALNMQVTSQAVQIGQKGILSVPLSKKQYNSLKKQYSAFTMPEPTASEPLLSVKKTTENPTSTVLKSDKEECTTQTLRYVGKSTAEDASVKSEQATLMVIGVHMKDGKLSKGETADKYLCLGSYPFAAASQLQFQVAGSSSVEKAWEVCADKEVPSHTALPIDLRYAITKQSVIVGDYGRVYIPLTAKQYEEMSKVYNRCCSDGSTRCF